MQKNNEALYAQIDQYLSGQLAEAESAAMRAALLEDAALAQEVELRRLEFEVAEELIAQTIRDQLHRLRTEPPPQNHVQSPKEEKFRPYIWAIIAAMLSIVAIGLYWWVNRSVPPSAIAPLPNTTPQLLPTDSAKQTPQATAPPAATPETDPEPPKAEADRYLALAQKYYRDPDLGTLRGTALDATPFETATAAWEKQDWAGVLAALDRVGTSDPQFIRAQVFRGHAQFKMKRYRLAAQTFKTISDSHIQPWAEEADWYILLALLADGRGKSAAFQTGLQKVLADVAHPYFSEAEALREALAIK